MHAAPATQVENLQTLNRADHVIDVFERISGIRGRCVVAGEVALARLELFFGDRSRLFVAAAAFGMLPIGKRDRRQKASGPDQSDSRSNDNARLAVSGALGRSACSFRRRRTLATVAIGSSITSTLAEGVPVARVQVSAGRHSA
jgi:hypothetical protein